ncbi:MAG: hypothetical protein FWC45_03010 [Treponema sp.]|nr:hypothetical protein [Treponema sp.]
MRIRSLRPQAMAAARNAAISRSGAFLNRWGNLTGSRGINSGLLILR